MPLKRISLAEKLAQFDSHWDPHVIADANGNDVMVETFQGELCIVPRGMVHRPRAEMEAKVLLIEPAGEPNTGDGGLPAAAKPRI